MENVKRNRKFAYGTGLTLTKRNDMIRKSIVVNGKLYVEVNNLVAFINTFLSYLLLAAVVTVLAGVAIFIGIRLRKNKDKQLES